MTLGKKSVRRKFTPEFRGQVVKRVVAGYKAAARALEMSERLLHNGLARFRLRHGAAALQAEPAAERTRLKRRWVPREAAVAILKTAAAYWARESRSGTPLSRPMPATSRSRRCVGSCRCVAAAMTLGSRGQSRPRPETGIWRPLFSDALPLSGPLRRAPDHAGLAGRGLAGESTAGGQTDTGDGAQGAGGAALQSDHTIDASPASGAQPTAAGLHGRRPQPAVGRRHHVPLDR